MTWTDTATEFWIPEEPIKYVVRKTEAIDGERNAGVHITRYADSDENFQQALLELRYDGDTVRLVQFDGDLDAKNVIAADQQVLSWVPFQTTIWRRIWKVAMA